MSPRPKPGSRKRFRGLISVDVAILVPRNRRLGVLYLRSDRTIELPWTVPESGESLLDAASRAAFEATGSTPTWIEQSGAFAAQGARDPLSIGYIATQPEVRNAGLGWLDFRASSRLPARQRWLLEGAVGHVRDRIDHQPIAFRMLPPRFSLAELQVVYEILLGRRLHKASFRRALHAAGLVKPTSEWFSSGRGRPAQLYRYAPRRRAPRPRPVRFDLL